MSDSISMQVCNSQLCQDLMRLAHAELEAYGHTDVEIVRIAKGLKIVKDDEDDEKVVTRIVTRSISRKSADDRIVNMIKNACDQVDNERRRRMNDVRKTKDNEEVTEVVEEEFEEEVGNDIRRRLSDVREIKVSEEETEVLEEEVGGESVEEIGCGGFIDDSVEGMEVDSEPAHDLESAHETIEGIHKALDKIEASHEDVSQMKQNLEEALDILAIPSNQEALEVPNGADNADLEILIGRFPNVESIDVRFCPNITKDGIKYIIDKCQNLKHLSLSFVPGNIMDCPEFQEIVKSSKSLKQLTVITKDLVDTTPYFGSSLKIFYFSEPDVRYYSAHNV